MHNCFKSIGLLLILFVILLLLVVALFLVISCWIAGSIGPKAHARCLGLGVGIFANDYRALGWGLGQSD